MRTYTVLGVNGDYCCVLTSQFPFDTLALSDIKKTSFVHYDCFDWGGCGKIDYTLKRIKMKQTGNVIVLNKPITFRGEDSDMGHCYKWDFTVKEIHELCDEQ